MNRFGISLKTTQLLQQTLASFKEIDHALIFGSRAIGNCKKGSDIDLAIYGSDLQPDTADKLHTVLNEEQPIPYFVDVLAPQYLKHKALLEHIERIGVSFYKKKGRGKLFGMGRRARA